MLDIIYLISPIFITILLGYLIPYFKFFKKEDFNIVGLLIIKISVPCLLFVSISSQNFESLVQIPYLLAYSAASLSIFLFTLILYRFFFKQPIDQSSIMAMGTSMSNTGFIGGGLLYIFLGPKAAIYFGMTFLVESLVIFFIFLICIELKSNQLKFRYILLKGFINALKNPIIISIFLGSIFSLFSIKLPDPIIQTLKPIGQTTIPFGLLAIGASLYGIRLRSQEHLMRDVIVISSLKLIALPICVYTFFQLFPGVDHEMIFAGVLLSSVSMVGLYGIFGQQYNMKNVPIILLMTTLFSVLSIATFIQLLPLVI